VKKRGGSLKNREGRKKEPPDRKEINGIKRITPVQIGQGILAAKGKGALKGESLQYSITAERFSASTLLQMTTNQILKITSRASWESRPRGGSHESPFSRMVGHSSPP